MYENTHTSNKVMSFTFYLFLYFVVFQYILTGTILKSQLIVYAITILSFLLFTFCFFRYGHQTNKYAQMWLPYLCLHICSLGLNGHKGDMPFWIISLLLLFIPSQIGRVFKPKVFVYIGLFFAGGVFFQYLFPSLYSSFIFPLFIGNASEVLESLIDSEYGYSGFSPQTGTTAYILLICLSVILAFKNDKSLFNKKYIQIGVLSLFVLAIFLTGKRMHSLISVILLLVSFYFSNSRRNKTQNVIILLAVFLGCYIILQYFIANIDQYADNVFLKRFVSSYIDASDGSDITSGRDILYEKAWSLFQQNQMLGIGANNYHSLSGMDISVHNTYLQVLCEEGILRFPFFVLPLIAVFLKTIKEVGRKTEVCNRNFLLLSLFLQIVFILYSFTGNTIVNTSNYIFYFMGISFLAYAKRVQYKLC